MKNYFSILTFLAPLLFPFIIHAQNVSGSISGEVRDAVTKQPLPGTNIVIAGTTHGSATNENGYYVIKNVPAGKYTLKASIIGYESASGTEVVVNPSQNKSVMFFLNASTVEMEAVEVRTDYFSKPAENVVSMRTLSPEEIRRSPGSAEDIFRVMQSMPGVATAGGKSAQLIVRGGSPDENLTLLDNIEIYNPIHFARSGESMGVISIINPALLEKVDFLTGGFPAKYGDKMSSVFEMTLQEGNKELYNSDVNANIAGFGVLVDGPAVDNSSMIFSLRRGFFDIITAIMDRPAAPRYYDAVGKLTYDLDPQNRISFVGFYYLDQIDREGATPGSAGITKYDFVSRDDYGTALGVNWRSLLSHNAYTLTTVSFTGNGWITRQGTESNRSLRGEDILENEVTLKSEAIYQVFPSLDFKFGGQVKLINSKNESWIDEDTTRTGTIIPASTITYKPNTTTKASLFAQTNYRLFEQLTMTAGLRLDHFELTNETNLSPRLAMAFHLTDKTALSVAYGAFSQSPASYQISPDPRNLLLKSSKAIHYVAGIDHYIGNDSKATIEVYRKDLTNLIVDPDSSNLLVNTGGGYAQGIEFSFQKKFTEGFVGSASYSYSVSRRKDDTAEPLYDFEYDRPHIINLIAGIEAGSGWQVGAKFQFASGNSYTPVVGVERRGGVYYLIDGEKNSARNPDYHKLDIRIDKQFLLGSQSLTVYLDLWNVYNRENIIAYTFKADASGTVVKSTRPDFGITPILGITAKF